MGPLIAIVGRPNVGKSSLFNKLIGEDIALIADYPGLTRDRNYSGCKIDNSNYILVDTGGITNSSSKFDQLILAETQKAISDADGLIFLVDSSSSINQLDFKINDILRKSGKNYVLVINKSETKESKNNISDFYSLGVKNSFEISAKNGLGMRNFKTSLNKIFPSNFGANDSQNDFFQIGILGKPNAGKSTYFNSILKDSRSIVSSTPGTTRDAISELITFKGNHIKITDTAGLRKKSKISDLVEKYSVNAAIKAMKLSEGIIYMIDGKESISDQDLHLIALTISSGKPLVIGINKSETLDKYKKTNVRKDLNRKLSFANDLEVKYISAKKNLGTSSLILSLIKLIKKSKEKLNPKTVNKVFLEAHENNPPPVKGRFRPKIKFIKILDTQPPTFVLHGNKIDFLSKQYLKYLENSVRKSLQLKGIPIKLVLKIAENPYKTRKNKLTKRQLNKRKRIRGR